MLGLKPTQAGTLIPVRVAPRASHNKITGVKQGALQVRLTAPPVDGAANQALIKLLAKALGLAKGRLSLASGQKSRDKVLLAQGITPEQVLAKLGPLE